MYDYRYTSGKGASSYAEEGFGLFLETHDFHLLLGNGFTSPVSSEVGEKSDQDADIDRICQIQD